jgi:hypothetical protein
MNQRNPLRMRTIRYLRLSHSLIILATISGQGYADTPTEAPANPSGPVLGVGSIVSARDGTTFSFDFAQWLVPRAKQWFDQVSVRLVDNPLEAPCTLTGDVQTSIVVRQVGSSTRYEWNRTLVMMVRDHGTKREPITVRSEGVSTDRHSNEASLDQLFEHAMQDSNTVIKDCLGRPQPAQS